MEISFISNFSIKISISFSLYFSLISFTQIFDKSIPVGIPAFLDTPEPKIKQYLLLFSELSFNVLRKHFNDKELFSIFPFIFRSPFHSFVYSRQQRAKWLLADIWRLPRGSNTPLLGSTASLIPRCLQRGL